MGDYVGTTLLSIIGSLVVFLLGLLLYLIKQTRADIERLEEGMKITLDTTKKEIIDLVRKPDCIRDMRDIRDDLKEAVRDVRVLERSKHVSQ
jgi:hypothetical protein